MIDVPSLGLELLNDATTYLAESLEDADDFDSAMAIMDTARKMVGRTQLRKALAATSKDATDHQRREKDVMHALTEAIEVRKME